MNKPTVFISYSHKDEDWKDRVVTHLGVMQHQGKLDIWDDRRIFAGDDWEAQIEQAMDAASIAVLLVSANSLTSDFILRKEVVGLLQRRDEQGLRIFPIIIKPCDWEAVDWLRRMQLRPKDGRAISGGNEYQIDADLAAVAKEIRLLLSRAIQRFEPEKLTTVVPDDISIAKLPSTGEHLFGREHELDLLDGAWADADTNVISLVAWGGVGKSALVNHWLGKMAKDNYRDAKRVYAWSFFSQGARETPASADEFIDAALRWFGDSDPGEGSPWDKGERLARLLRQEQTLLILDGLEPLQNPPGPDEGKLKDPALAALVRELAAANPGLLVITTRHRVADIDHHSGSTAPVIELEQLSDAAGAALLRALGVDGPEEELQLASREFGGHGLALNLLGTYLRDVFAGDVRRRNEVSLLEEDAQQGGQAWRVMTSYEKSLGEGPELEVLRLIGLFNRPADSKAIAALRAGPAIPDLAEHLQGLSDARWQRVLAKLRRARLLAQADPRQPDTLDAHPLVREHFGKQLRETYPDAWREGNDRLYEHLKQVPKQEFPDTLEEMAPLYAAVPHGCAAGRHQEALEEVYWSRIQREDEFFSTKNLGAHGADLAALAGFFDPPWRRPAAELTEAAKGFVLNAAGFRLRALGRLEEAIEPMLAGFDADIAREDWQNAAISASNLSVLHLTIGELVQALDYAQKSVELADQSDNAFQRMGNRTTLANVLRQAGRMPEAEALFREAEAMQKERQPDLPLLYSTQGFWYCELLLGRGEYGQVQDRAGQTLKWAKQSSGGSLLEIPLDHLSLGRAHLLEAQQEGTGDFSEAAEHLDQAVDGLQEAGNQDYLPGGFLARAALHRVRKDFDRARRDLDEATSIAERGGMGLHQADAHLEYAWLHLATADKPKARESLATAKRMVESMGYHRRKGEVAELEDQLSEKS